MESAGRGCFGTKDQVTNLPVGYQNQEIRNRVS